MAGIFGSSPPQGSPLVQVIFKKVIDDTFLRWQAFQLCIINEFAENEFEKSSSRYINFFSGTS